MRWSSKVGLAGLLLATACSAAPTPSPTASGSASTLPRVAAIDLYHPAADAVASATPGQIIASVEVQAAPGMRAWTVVYGSIGLDGKPVAVSGMILAPSAPASADGYPIVSWAHGTTGAADQCAPSRAGIEGIPREFRDLVDRGHVVAATDYEGLGTDGVHPYIVGVSEGRSVLDSIRAAQNLADAHAGSGAVVIGHSQGGHAALFAAQLAPTYAPSLDLRGVLAASPPADLLAFDDWALRLSAAGHPNVAGPPVLVFGIWHDIYGLPLDFLTADAQAMTVSGAQSCGFPRPLANPFLSDPALDPAWRERLVENSPGSVATSVPILIVASADDEQVPHDSQVSGADAMCQAGDDVELRTVPGNHLASLWSATAWGSAQAWIADALAGEAVIPTC